MLRLGNEILHTLTNSTKYVARALTGQFLIDNGFVSSLKFFRIFQSTIDNYLANATTLKINSRTQRDLTTLSSDLHRLTDDGGVMFSISHHVNKANGPSSELLKAANLVATDLFAVTRFGNASHTTQFNHLVESALTPLAPSTGLIH